MSLGTRFLVLVAPAILPAIDPDERDFYQILGVSRNASSDDIKKSYRAKSLALHPDKIAQRNKSAEEAKAAAAEYELVQEAYNVLNDPKQRQTFDGVQCSVARFRFLQSGQAVNPTALHENLAASSVADKTRLVSVAVLLCFLFLFQPILIAAKVNAIVSNSTSSSMYGVKWTVLLIPWWLVQIVVLLMNFALFFLEAKVMRVVPVVVGHIFWFIGCIVLARAWDSPPDNWHAVAVPFYFWIVSNLVAALVDIREVGVEIDKMVSPEKLQDLAGSEATEEDLMELAQQYTVITVDPMELAAAIQISNATNDTSLTNEEIEDLKIAMSPEYDMNQKLLKYHYGQIIKSLVVDLPLLILIALRVDGQISASWWVVCLPLLIFIIVKLFQSCFVCVFAFQPDPELVVVHEDETTPDEADDEAEKETPEKGTTAKADGLETQVPPYSTNDSSEQPPPPTTTEEALGEASKGADPLTNPSSEAADLLDAASSDPQTDDPVTSSDVQPVTDSSTKQVDFSNKAPADPKNDSSAKKTDPPTATLSDAQAPDVESPDAGEQPGMDEETYRAWQSAFSRAEESVLEKQAKAQSTCCSMSFQLVMVCLIIGKLDSAVDGEEGYNTFWILFPIFLVTGIVLCCCSCLIYGAESLDGMMPTTEEGTEEDDNNNGASGENIGPIVIPTPTPTSTNEDAPPDVEAPPAQETHPESADADNIPVQPPKPAEPEEDLNDLD